MLVLVAAVFSLGCQAGPEEQLEEARVLHDAGEYEASLPLLRELATERSDLPEASYRLGLALVATGRKSAAVWPLRKAAESDEYAVDAGLLLASTLLMTEDFEEAARAASAVLLRDADNRLALHSRARANIGAKHPADALVDADRLIEADPDDFQALVMKSAALIDLERYDEAEPNYARLRELTESESDPDLAARACALQARFHSAREEAEKADREFAACLEEHPTHPLLLAWATRYYASTKRPDEAVAARRNAIEQAPENPQLRYDLAELLVHLNRPADAEEELAEAARIFDTGDAWLKLASFYREEQRWKEAGDALEQALARAPGEPAPLQYEHVILLAEQGDVKRARAVAEKIGEPVFREPALGRVLVAEDRPEEALRHFEAGLEEWPNNAMARFHAGEAARALGDLDRALSEYGEAVRASKDGTDAALAAARILFWTGRYAAALQYASLQIEHRPLGDGGVVIIAARSLVALERYDEARKALQRFNTVEGSRAQAWIERAHVERAQHGPAAAADLVAGSRLDLATAEAEPVLAVLVRDRLAASQADAAVSAVRRALDSRPDAPALYGLLGLALLVQGEAEGAETAFQRALEIDPANAVALAGLGDVAFQRGDKEGALGFFERAAAADPDAAQPAYRAAQMELASGRPARARERLEETLSRDPGYARAANDLAWLLAEGEEELDRALELAQRAVRLDPAPETLDTLGFVYLQRREPEAAVEPLEQAVREDSASASIRYRLGLALAESGQSGRALELLRQAVESGPFPEAPQASAAIARLEQSPR